MPFLMGVVSQKYLNARKMFLLTVTLTFIGHTLCTISLFTKQFPLLIIGRGLVGIGTLKKIFFIAKVLIFLLTIIKT